MWIYRDLSPFIGQLPKNFIGLLTGPRQCGKSALLIKFLGKSARLLECDDLHVRIGLNSDPALFLGELNAPLIIDEAQHVPNIFSELKLRVDRARREGRVLPPIWLTGSNQLLLSKGVKESLAGRSYHLNLMTLSVHELKRDNLYSYENYLWKGGWPELIKDDSINTVQYLDDYITSFVEKDVALASGVTKIGEFLLCLKLLAARIGYPLNASQVGGRAGVKGETLQNWIHLLERNHLVSLVPPFFENASKRLLKSPTFYFNDIALAVRLQGHQSYETMLLSPQIGMIFQNMVFCELARARIHLRLPFEVFSYRTREGEEVDFLIRGRHKVSGEVWLALEVKFARQGQFKVNWPKAFNGEKYTKIVVTLAENIRPHSEEILNVPIHELADHLSSWLGKT